MSKYKKDRHKHKQKIVVLCKLSMTCSNNLCPHAVPHNSDKMCTAECMEGEEAVCIPHERKPYVQYRFYLDNGNTVTYWLHYVAYKDHVITGYRDSEEIIQFKKGEWTKDMRVNSAGTL